MYLMAISKQMHLEIFSQGPLFAMLFTFIICLSTFFSRLLCLPSRKTVLKSFQFRFLLLYFLILLLLFFIYYCYSFLFIIVMHLVLSYLYLFIFFYLYLFISFFISFYFILFSSFSLSNTLILLDFHIINLHSLSIPFLPSLLLT